MFTRYIALLLLLIAVPSMASSSIRIGQHLISVGDSLQTLYVIWGEPDYALRSVRTCNTIAPLKPQKCSRTRKVWKQKDIYWIVQHKDDQIIKIAWTRFASSLTDSI